MPLPQASGEAAPPGEVPPPMFTSGPAGSHIIGGETQRNADGDARIQFLLGIPARNWSVAECACVFDWIADTLWNDLVHYAYRFSGSFEDATDAVEDAIEYVFRYYDPSKGKLPSFLYYLIPQRAEKIGKKKQRRERKEISLTSKSAEGEEQELNGPDPSATPEEIVIGKEDRELMRKALAQLSLQDQQILLWRAYEELSYDEIGEKLGIKGNAAKTRYCRTLSGLRGILKKGGDPQ